MMGIKTGSLLFMELDNFQPYQFFKDSQHVWFEGEWPKLLELTLFAKDLKEGNNIIEKWRILNKEKKQQISKRMAVYPFCKGKHKLLYLKQMKDATR